MFLQPFNNWLDGTREDLVDMFIVHTMEEIQGLLDAHSQFKATLGEADKEYNSIVNLVREVETTVQKYQVPGGLENPYTTLTAHVRFVIWFYLNKLNYGEMCELFRDLFECEIVVEIILPTNSFYTSSNWVYCLNLLNLSCLQGR